MSERNRRGRRSGRHGSASGKGNLLAFVLLGGAALAVGGILAAKSILSPANASWDQATLCPSTGPTAVHVVLVDRSDPITPLQAQRVRQVMDRIIEDAQPGERIDLYIADGDGRAALTPRVSLCNPGREGNALYQNPRRIRERYETSFKAPVEATMASMLEPAGRGSSPIIESIKSVCVGAFGSLPQGRATRFTLVSDMLQHSSLISHFRERDFEAFARSPRLALGLADCRNAQFSVLYLLRPEHRRIQDRGHQLFWEKLIDRNNARLIRVEAI